MERKWFQVADSPLLGATTPHSVRSASLCGRGGSQAICQARAGNHKQAADRLYLPEWLMNRVQLPLLWGWIAPPFRSSNRYMRFRCLSSRRRARPSARPLPSCSHPAITSDLSETDPSCAGMSCVYITSDHKQLQTACEPTR